MKLKENFCGLAVMRLQPMHWGHVELIDRMIKECVHPIVAIGSSQCSRTYGNPFSYKERAQMLKNYYGKKCPTIVPVKDIFNLGAWARYALDSVEKQTKRKPEIYYCGSDQDGALFLKEGIRCALIPRKHISGGYGRGMELSATRIRNWVLAGSSEWKQYVPNMNHKLIVKVYGSKAK